MRPKLRLSKANLIYGAVIFLFYLPLLTVIGKALFNKEALLVLPILLKSARFLNALSFSVKEALASAIASLLLALPGAYLLAHYDFKGKSVWRSAMLLPFMLPSILVVLGMVAFYGQNGLLNQLLRLLFPDSGWQFKGLYGFWGIVLANTFYNFTFGMRVLGESWERITPQLLEAAAVLGSSPRRIWWRVILPLLAPTLGMLFILIFLYSFLSFTVVLVLGGYLYKTLEVLIYIELNNNLHFEKATLIATIQLVILSGLLYLQTFLGGKVIRQIHYQTDLPRLGKQKKPLLWTFLIGFLILASGFFVAPLFAVILRAFKERGLPDGVLTLANFSGLGGPAFQFSVGADLPAVLLTSLSLSGSVALITLSLAYYLARSRRYWSWRSSDLWLQMPLGISFLTFGFGLIYLAGNRLPAWLLVIWAQTFMAFPLCYSIMRNAWREMGNQVLEAGEILGAQPRDLLFKVELPLMKRAIVTAAAYAVAFSMGDLTAVLVLGRGEVITLPLAIYRLIGHYHLALAVALGTLFIIWSLVLYLLIEKEYQAFISTERT